MSHIEVTDELLYKYVPILDKVLIEEIESQVDYNYQFSEEFERKMKRLIWKEEHMWVGDFLRFIRKVAIIFLCIIGVMFALTMSVEAYRIKFFQTMQKIWEDSIIYTYFTEVDDQSFHSREPQYVPDGYEIVRYQTTDDLLSIVYENDKGEQIFWDQMMVVDSKYSILDSEYETQVVREFDEGILTISLYSDGYVIARYERGTYVYVLVASNLSLEEINKIFDSAR